MHTNATQHIFILGDQLTRQVGPLAEANPATTIILMIESVERGRLYPYHKQKLVLLYSAMRHFCAELRQAGFAVCYRQVATFGDGLAAHLAEYPGASLTLMEPADWGVADQLNQLTSQYGGQLVLVPNALWLTSEADWQAYANGKRQLRMEFFYRSMRRTTGWLMEGDQPLGGRWNYDTENRAVPEANHRFPPRPHFPPDALTAATRQWVEQTFPDHFGSSTDFNWPVTRAAALELLQQFLRLRLARFGPYEDAMRHDEPVLYHSLLSAVLNLGLLTAREVCEAALAYATVEDVPLASLEGFIRQILGWREFLRHIYRTRMPALREENQLGQQRPLPAFYWNATTEMRCLASTVRQLQASGHTHHIQRLMLLGNFALLAGVSPQAINDWFLLAYVDAYDWVVTPNVLGMSQYADGGSFVTKPYVSGAAYINRMSTYCGGCRYNPAQTIGEHACPFASLYWHFLDRHAARLRANPRMAVIVNGWLRRTASERQAVLAQAAHILQRLDANQL